MTHAKISPITYRNFFRNDAFESVDRNSYMVTGYLFASLDELLQNLFFSSNFDEFMKIRAIFTWLSFVDVHKLGFNCHQNVELCKALNCLKFGGSYAEAFMKLANHIGINAVCIKGWAKGHNFLKSNLSWQPANHSWNAVEIKCKWFLLDCYWSKSVSEDGKPEMDDFYFLVDPRNMIFSHFPELPAWQLLPEPISFEFFIEIPALKPDFFRFKLKLNDYSTPCVSENGLTVLTLQHNANIFFKCKIFKTGVKSESHGFKHFIFEELNSSSVTYYFRAPEKGIYVLKVFASTTDYSFANKFLIYKEVADFLIVTDAHSLVTPFPYSTDACWGVSNPYLSYIYPSMVSAFVFSNERKMSFSMKKMNDIIFIRVCPSSLSKLSSMAYFEEDTKFNIFFDAKRLDAYGIEIYATDASQPKTFNFIGQILICFDEFLDKNCSTSIENGLQSISEDVLGSKCKGNLGLRQIFKLVAGGTLLNQNNYMMECVLNKVKTGMATRAHAFEWLCSLNGYGCITISGLLKGFQSDFNYEKKHLWNAVFINGSWHLVDCHLGRKLDIFGLYESAIEDYYFLPDPRNFIHTHFPFDLKWQLLETPVSLGDFQNLVNVKPAYFKNNLLLVQPTMHCINVQGEAIVILKQNVEMDLSFKCSLVFWNDKKLGFNNYVMHYFNSDLVIFQIRLPIQGTYHLVLYVKDVRCENHEEICEFVVENEMVCSYLKSFIPSSSCWGYTNFAKKNGLKSSLKTPFIETSDGSVKVSIYALKKFKLSVEFENYAGERVNCTNLMTKINNNVEILVNCPEVGEYCLKVFALNVEDCDSVLHKAFQLYVMFPFNNFSSDDNIVEAGVKIPFGFLGSQPSNVLFDVILLGGLSAAFESKENIVELTFYDRMNIDLSCTLVSVNPLSNFSSLVLKQKTERFTNFIVLLPKEGYYLFQLYGSEHSYDFLNIYNVLINCKCIPKEAFEFPKQLRAWNGFLHHPLQKCLKLENNAMEFQLEKPASSSVCMMVDHRSIPFTQTNGVWHLILNLSEFLSGCQMKICACDDHDHVNELLEYMII